MKINQEAHVSRSTKFNMDQSPKDHDPSLYQTTKIAQCLEGIEQLHDRHIEKFHAEGYLAIENIFSIEQAQEAKQAIIDLQSGANDRFTVEQDVFMELDQSERPILRKLMNFCQYSPCLEAMRDDHRIREILSRMFSGKAPVICQEMALQKLPGGREKPWHQDKAYFTQSLNSLCVGVWIALDDATLKNGCMRVLPRGHHSGPYPHFQRRDWQICDTDIQGQEIAGVPLKAGGCLLFNSMLPHGTPTNNTNQSRRALQFHYLPEDAKEITEMERHAIWGGDGRNLTC